MLKLCLIVRTSLFIFFDALNGQPQMLLVAAYNGVTCRAIENVTNFQKFDVLFL
jgi:hypothetical protein